MKHFLGKILPPFRPEWARYESLFEEQDILGITSDSRQVKKGFIYVAIKGGSINGHQFLEAIHNQGAAILIGTAASSTLPKEIQKKYIQVHSSHRALGILSSAFYGNPSQSVKIFGVTGTCGKTTTTYLLESILKECGYRVGVIGTVNFRSHTRILPSTQTTPGAVELQALMAEMIKDGVTAIVLEVSSHGLKQERVAGVFFDSVGFLNLSPEHLDFHPDMEDYYQSKKLLFTRCALDSASAGKIQAMTIYIKDEWGSRLYSELANQVGIHAYSVDKNIINQNINPIICPTSVQISAQGITLVIDQVTLKSSLIGNFNVNNILVAYGMAKQIGLDESMIQRGLKKLMVAPGRLESVKNSSQITVLVDYAHKSDALENVLKTLTEIKGTGKLILVFGCGGDRDRLKRPVMGSLAVRLSDYVIVTSDNPRTEDPLFIISEILLGIKSTQLTNYNVEQDRKSAIIKAVNTAQAGDIILIAGKGHEDYQIIADPLNPGNTIKIHFDDREVAAAALKNK